METKHTPGPWSWSRDTMENRCDITLHSEATGYSILYCCEKPREPNARLMAAAPDLLAALKEADEDFAREGFDKDGPYRAHIIAAIAKATGKNNEL